MPPSSASHQPPESSRVHQHTIDLSGTPVFYRSAPTPDALPPVLYLHTIPTSSDDWADALARTGGIAPDLIGFGRSGKPGHLDYSLAGQAEFLDRLLAQLGVPRFRLVAHGFGAGGGLLLAQRHPDRVERLVLCDALPLLDGFTWPRLARMIRRPGLGELIMGATSRRLLARTLRSGSGTAGGFSPERLRAVWEQFDQGTQRAFLCLLRSAGERDLAAAGDRLQTLRMPTLIVWGERDPWLPAALADAYARRLPQATVAKIADAGHWPWLDSPEALARITAFVGEAR